MKLLRSVLKLSFLVFVTSASTLAATPPKYSEVVIAGAGLSGLATAYNLKKAGIPYHILEISPRVGGRVRTAHYTVGDAQISTDSGMEEYWASNPAVKLLEDLKLPFSHDVAQSSIVLQGKLYALGDEDKESFLKRIFNEQGYLALKSFEEKVKPVLAELKRAPKLRSTTLALKDISFADWVRKHELPAVVSDWIRVSLECEIGTEWDKISALDGISEYHIFIGAGEECYRVEGGNERFTSALAEVVGNENISLNMRVTRIKTEGKRVYVSYLDTATNSYRTIETRHFVSTIPLFRLFEVQFEPQLSDQKQQAIQTQTWGAYFKAHVFLDEAATSFWSNAESSVLPILSDSELGVIYEGNSEGATRVLSLLITGSRAEAFNFMPLDQVREIVKAGLDKLWPGIAKKIKAIEFHRLHPRAIAAWPVGRSRFDELSEAIRKPEHGVYLAGDFTETSHSDGAFISAKRVVEQIRAARRQRTSE